MAYGEPQAVRSCNCTGYLYNGGRCCTENRKNADHNSAYPKPGTWPWPNAWPSTWPNPWPNPAPIQPYQPPQPVAPVTPIQVQPVDWEKLREIVREEIARALQAEEE